MEVGLGAEKRGGGDRTSWFPSRLAAARARSWRRWRRGNYLLPGSGTIFGLETFWNLGVARGIVISDATDSQATDSASSEPGDSCRTERSRLRSRKRVFREQATSASQAEEALALGPRPGDCAATAVTAARLLSRPAQGSRPPVTAVTSPVTAFTAPLTAITATSGPEFRGGVGCRGSGFHHPISRSPPPPWLMLTRPHTVVQRADFFLFHYIVMAGRAYQQTQILLWHYYTLLYHHNSVIMCCKGSIIRYDDTLLHY